MVKGRSCVHCKTNGRKVRLLVGGKKVFDYRTYDTNPFENDARNGSIIILDTCFLMDSKFDRKLICQLKSALKKHKNSIYIPQKVSREIIKHKKNFAKKEDAERADKIIAELNKEGLVKVARGSAITKRAKYSSFGDAEIMSIVAGNMADSPVLVLTQDKELASFICSMNHQEAVKGPGVKVKRISNGRLEAFELKHAFLYSDRTNAKNANCPKNTLGHGYSPVGKMLKDLVAIENIKNSNSPQMVELKRILKDKILTWKKNEFVKTAEKYSVKPNVDKMVDALLASLNDTERQMILSQIKYKKEEPKIVVKNRATEVDEKLVLTAKLVRGNGRYEKGFLWKKKDFLNFKLKIYIKNREELKISSIVAKIRCGNNIHKQKIITELESETDFDLPARDFSGMVEARVEVRYKIAWSSSKTIFVDISNNF